MTEEKKFDREKVKIYISEHSEEDCFAYAEYDSKNLYCKMTLCDFVEDCEWWDYENVRNHEKDGHAGWLFSKKDTKESIFVQIQSFIYQYHDIICRD